MKRLLIAICVSLCAVTSFAGTRDLKQSTARTIVVGPFMDPTTGAPETSLTVTSIDGTLFKATGTASDLGSITASGGSNDMVHQDDGMYSLELTTTNTDTAGDLTLCLYISDALVLKEDFHILPTNIYESRYSTTAQNVAVGSGGITTASFASGAIDAAAVAANAIGASELADDAIDAGAIATDAIGAAELAANSITSSEVADDSIDAGAIATAAITNAESSMDGSELVSIPKPQSALMTSVATVNSTTAFELSAFTSGTTDGYKDYNVVIIDVSSGTTPLARCVRRITGDDGSSEITINAAADFTVVAGDLVELYPPNIKTQADVAAILVDTGTTLDDFVDGVESSLADGTSGLAAIKTAVDGVSAGTSPNLLQTTTITGLSSQTVFNLTAGSADNDAYNNQLAVIVDASTAVQKASIAISDYVGSTKTVTLAATPIFTIANGDTIHIIAAPPASVSGTVDANLVALGGVTQSLNDLKDFADAGYDPSTNRVDANVKAIDEGATASLDDVYVGSQLETDLAAKASQVSVTTIDDFLDTEIAAIQTKTGFLPSATAGAAGGLTIAGTNAATTFATLTSTGAFSINGTSNVAQTGDSFARLGAPAGSSIADDISDIEGGGGGGLTEDQDQKLTLTHAIVSNGTYGNQELRDTVDAIGTIVTATATSASTAATQSTGANTKAADLQSRVPDALVAGNMKSTGDFVLTTPQVNSIANALVNAGVGVNITPVNQEPVPVSREWILKATDSDGFQGELPISITLNDLDNLFSVEFRNALFNNGRLASITNVEIIEGDEDGIELGADLEDTADYGVDKSKAKFRLSPLLSGTYVIGITCARVGGGSAYGEVTLVVP